MCFFFYFCIRIKVQNVSTIIVKQSMKTALYSKTTNSRDSNMELLRVVAMLLVCIVHANFRALPVPTHEEVFPNVSSSILRYFTESVSIICVNLFVLLSGWYGIKFKLDRLKEFFFKLFRRNNS